MKANGLAVLFIGAAGAMSGLLLVGEDGRLSSGSPLLLICALTLGGLLGEWVRIEDRMEKLGNFLQKKMGGLGGRFSEGFVTNTLVICVGAMAVVGAFNDGLLGDPTLLYTKALLDGVISMVFAGTLGVGVLFAALPLGIYQGGADHSRPADRPACQRRAAGRPLAGGIGAGFCHWDQPDLRKTDQGRQSPAGAADSAGLARHLRSARVRGSLSPHGVIIGRGCGDFCGGSYAGRVR